MTLRGAAKSLALTFEQNNIYVLSPFLCTFFSILHFALLLFKTFLNSLSIVLIPLHFFCTWVSVRSEG